MMLDTDEISTFFSSANLSHAGHAQAYLVYLTIFLSRMDSLAISENERAAKVKTYNLRTVITALACAGAIAVVALVVGLIRHVARPLRAMTQVPPS